MANHTQIDIYSIIDYVAEDRGEHEHGFAIEVALKVRAAYEAERDALNAELEKLKFEADLRKHTIESLQSAYSHMTKLKDSILARLKAARKQEPDSWRITASRFCGTHTTDKDVAIYYLAQGLAYPLYASPVPAQQECTFHGADAQACMDYSKEVPCEFTWEQEAKRAFWCGLEIGAAFGSCAILPRWNEYIEKRKSELKGGENER